MKLSKQLHWIIYFAFVLSCARQTAPTGGPKDTIPPSLVKANPANEQVNFHDNSIELTFSELIQLNNPKEQLIITPSIGKDYKILAKRQTITLSWDKPLLDTTTYTFNFRDAVQDLTERNPVRKLRVAFSTGEYIDSLSITGRTFTLLDDNIIKDVTVALQPYSDTFNIFKHSPTYFTKADEKGVYKLENLKVGKYLLYAWTDQNKNLVVDSKSEKYGFKSTPVSLTSDLADYNIPLVKLDTRELKLTSARPYNTYFNIRASKYLSKAEIQSVDTILTYALASDPSNIILYNTFHSSDSVQIKINIADSIQNTVDTVLYAKFNQQTATPEKFKVTSGKSILLADEGRLEASFTFSKPILSLNFDSLYFQIDSINILRFNIKNLTYDTTQRTLQLRSNIDKLLYKKVASADGPPTPAKGKSPKQINELIVGKGAFISIEKDSSAQANQKISPKYFDDLGVIIVEVKTTEPSLVLQLLDTKKTVLQQVINQPKVTFNNLPPGDYLLRVIHDTNNNGRWDPGNYFLKREPEAITYYQNEKQTKEIKLKANFELGPLLITY